MPDQTKIGFVENFTLSGAAAIISIMAAAPIERVKLMVQNQDEMLKAGRLSEPYKGIIDCTVRTFRTEGAVYCADSCNRLCYFGFYDTLKPIFLGEEAGFWASFILGYGVTISSGLISYPFDTIRRRMMMTSGEAVKYKGSFDCFVQIVKKEGFMSLMKGAGASILRGIVGAGVLSGYDVFKGAYIRWRTG